LDGQQWTDGVHSYSDDGSFWGDRRESPHDLVSFVGLLPVSRPAETESTTAVAGGVSEDPGRVIHDLEEKLKAANAEIDRLGTVMIDAQSRANTQRIDQQAEIDRLKTELLQLKASVPKAAVEIDRLNTVLGEQASVIDSLKESNERLQAEALQAQKYVSEANEKINQQTRTIEHLNDKVRSLERFNDDKECDLDHLRQLRRTNEAIIKELRTLLTYALSKK
jgi:peptidoglycan hydrolase CwlO-like protein